MTSGAVDRRAQLAVGSAAILFPVVYFLSDVLEVAQGEFTTSRLFLTYVGEAGLTLGVVGICFVLGNRLSWWGAVGGIAYAYAYLFFTSTVVWAIVARTPDWETLGDDFGWWLTVHGALMTAGGVALGIDLARSRALPRWTGIALACGVVLVAAASGLGNLERSIAAAVPDAAFIGMGLALLRQARQVPSQ